MTSSTSSLRSSDPGAQQQKSSGIGSEYVRFGSTTFFAGEKPGYGECFVFHNIDQCLTLADKELTEAIGEESMKPLKAFHKRFSELS